MSSTLSLLPAAVLVLESGSCLMFGNTELSLTELVSTSIVRPGKNSRAIFNDNSSAYFF